VYSRVFKVREFKYDIRIFKGAKTVDNTIKFRQKSAKIEPISVLCKISRIFVNGRFFEVGEFKCVIQIFKGSKRVAMTITFTEKEP